MEEKKQESQPKWKNRARSAIYPMAGVYLLYLAYEMFHRITESRNGEQMLMIIFTFLFSAIGLSLIIVGVCMFYRIKKEEDSCQWR